MSCWSLIKQRSPWKELLNVDNSLHGDHRCMGDQQNFRACASCRVEDTASSHACDQAFVGELSTWSNYFGATVQSQNYPLSQPLILTIKAMSMILTLSSCFYS